MMSGKKTGNLVRTDIPVGRSVFSAAIIVIGHVKILSVKSLLVLNSLINLD